MEIIWTEIFSNDELRLFHTFFKKMEIIKIQLKDKEKQKWKFEGCYILNLDYNNDFKKLSDFHFYTTNYFLNNSVKRMCIQPLSILDNNHKNDNDEDINNRLITWFLNGERIFKYGIDILGQSHGQFINEKMDQFLSGVDWDLIKIENNKKNIKQKIKNNFYDTKSGVFIAELLCKDEVLDIIINSKKVTIDDIFNY